MTEKENSQPSPPPGATEVKSPRPSKAFDVAIDAGISRSGKVQKSIPIGDSAPTPLTVNSAAPPPPPPLQGKTKK